MLFFAVHQHESATGAHVSSILNSSPSLSPLHPSRLFQTTSFGCPTSCIKLALVIYFTYANVHFNVILSDYTTKLQ